ncbi:MAG: hypothetical protein WCP99_22520 [Burkholderiales bacterium]
MCGELTWIKLGAAIAALLVALTSGWIINGWRWNNTALKLAAAQTQARIDAEQKSRNQELALQAAANNARNIKDAEINIIRDQLDAALVSLRERPLRGANLPGTASTCVLATGAQLSREDAEFLAREAARADAIIAELKNCHVIYNTAREAMVEKPRP